MKSVLFLVFFLPLVSLGQKTESSGLKKLNGTNLFVSIHGQGEVLVVLHGGPGLNHAYFRPHLDALHKNFKVVYYDQRACGQSAIPSTDSISMQFFVDDLESFRKELNVPSINILAHSWASILAVNYALTHPDKVNKLILSNPVPLSKEYEKEMAGFIQSHTTSADSLERARIVSGKEFTTETLATLFKISFQASAYNRNNMDKLNLDLPENFMQAQQALFTGLGKDLMNYNYYDDVKKITFPVLILHGKSDGIPMASVVRLKNSIPRTTLKVFEKSGHFPFIEEPDLYLKTITNFLKANN